MLYGAIVRIFQGTVAVLRRLSRFSNDVPGALEVMFVDTSRCVVVCYCWREKIIESEVIPARLIIGNESGGMVLLYAVSGLWFGNNRD